MRNTEIPNGVYTLTWYRAKPRVFFRFQVAAVVTSSSPASHPVTQTSLCCRRLLLFYRIFIGLPTVSPQANQYAYSPGEAVTLAQDVVKTMLAKGYVLGTDALGKAKAFDESYHVSASAAAKVAELSQRIGLTDKVCAGVEAVRSIDKSYHISDTTKSIVAATRRSTAAAATTVVKSGYFSKGAFWVSDVLSRAAKAAADLGSHGASK